MAPDCDNRCSACSEDCASRKPADLADFIEQPHEKSSIKRVIAVVSGKGGVGKSMTCAELAVLLQRRGYQVGILDADITGPSIPQMFGVHTKPLANQEGMLPVRTGSGIQLMSMNLLLDKETDPVVWRGPVLGGVVKQFWQQVIWQDVDFMIVDLPPGTGDVPLSVFQMLPLDGIFVVTTPQEIVNNIVSKAVKMAGLMRVPVLGLVENMSYVRCPDCGREIPLFGKSHTAEVAKQFGIPLVARQPIDPEVAELADTGAIETVTGEWMAAAADVAECLLQQPEVAL